MLETRGSTVAVPLALTRDFDISTLSLICCGNRILIRHYKCVNSFAVFLICKPCNIVDTSIKLDVLSDLFLELGEDCGLLQPWARVDASKF